VKRDGENTTHGESVQPLQIVKLVYQPCSWSRAAWTSSRLDGSGWLGGSLGKGTGGSVGNLDGIQVWCLDGIQVWFGLLREGRISPSNWC
jgi:hypothetical protein